MGHALLDALLDLVERGLLVPGAHLRWRLQGRRRPLERYVEQGPASLAAGMLIWIATALMLYLLLS